MNIKEENIKSEEALDNNIKKNNHRLQNENSNSKNKDDDIDNNIQKGINNISIYNNEYNNNIYSGVTTYHSSQFV